MRYVTTPPVRLRQALAAVTVACALTVAPSAGAQEGPRLVQPGAPGQPTRAISAAEATDVSAVRHTDADVRFMHDMIAHHAQAIEMVALVNSRSQSIDVQRLALRIDVSQSDELQMMREWLERRGEALPARHGQGNAHEHMPGMLTPEQMHRLASARGPAFDRLFLESMIQHHEGALDMVQALLATPGAAQEPDMFDFVSEIEADQAMEIARMRAMLKELPQ